MTATMNYDRPVANFIDGLSATGHVTHRTDPKTMVTLHHNGGVNFSHQKILDIWKTRPASAHFDVDSAGALAQYVEEHEYAWACASSEGNRKSISIEMANSTGAPGWLVSDTTWKSAARLTGWLFAHVIEGRPRPTAATLVFHSHWYATACAGPYMAKIYTQVLAEAQRAYDAFINGTTPAAKDWFDMATQADLEKALTNVLLNNSDVKREIARFVWEGFGFGPDGSKKVGAGWFTILDQLARIQIEAASDDLTAEQIKAALTEAVTSSVKVEGSLSVSPKPAV